jgi:hypothetical protein
MSLEDLEFQEALDQVREAIRDTDPGLDPGLSMRSREVVHARAEVLAFIVAYKQAHDGVAPSLREIGRACGIASTSNVKFILEELELAGYLRLPDPGHYQARSIEVVGGRWEYRPHNHGE